MGAHSSFPNRRLQITRKAVVLAAARTAIRAHHHSLTNCSWKSLIGVDWSTNIVGITDRRGSGVAVGSLLLTVLDRGAQWRSELYRKWKVHAASEFGKGLVRSGFAFAKGRRRRKGEKERGRDRVPGKPRAREGSHNGRNGGLVMHGAQTGREGGKRCCHSMGSVMSLLGRGQARGLYTSTLRE